MARKCVVKVVLSKQQREILIVISTRLGISASEAMRTALMDYAKQVNIITETIHWSEKQLKDTHPNITNS
jgi:hypothetical protein